MRMRYLLPLLAVVVLAAAVPTARHLALSKAEPGVDATVTQAPRSINLFFTQAPQIRATSVELKTQAGAAVALGDLKADEADAKIVRAPITAAVAPGVHEVTWRALSSDGHVVSGTYRFTYRPTAEGATN